MKKTPKGAANNISLMLNAVFGADRFEKGPVDVARLALEYTKQIEPRSHIVQIVPEDLPDCEGALVPGDGDPRRWAIMYNRKQNAGRRAYTIAHELGHFVLHRKLVDGAGRDIEKEANEFAATLLMPLDDFRRFIPSDNLANLERLGQAAERYGVSLTAAALRWLEYTKCRAMLIASVDGYALWGKSSEAALKSGRFIRTKNEMFELPATSMAALKAFGDDALTGVRQPAGVWFPEPAIEMCMRTDRYDFELTLLHFEGRPPAWQGEEMFEDVCTHFFTVAGKQ